MAFREPFPTPRSSAFERGASAREDSDFREDSREAADTDFEAGSDSGSDAERRSDDPETEGAETQPADENGVDEDMASIAIDQSLGAPSGLKAAGLDAVRSPTAGELSAMTDAEIMLRVREGDDSGFDFLIQKYRNAMIHFMFRMVHNQAIAEELAQEVFLRVYRSRQSYRAEAKFTTWLYRIATNLGVNHARDTKYERAAQNVYLDQPDPETGTTPDVADLTASVEQELVKDERMRAIRQHVLALPERQKNAVLMHKYQGLDYKQIGEVLKLSESATKSLLFRAYQTLRERLKDFV